ncbi:hypothetical protein Ddc_15751 [Ditylenchus destructor]|nr:hypothetical protein Ddc_15751 [Ditylenchus destructor]
MARHCTLAIVPDKISLDDGYLCPCQCTARWPCLRLNHLGHIVVQRNVLARCYIVGFDPPAGNPRSPRIPTILGGEQSRPRGSPFPVLRGNDEHP